MSKTRNFCFTINNPIQNELDQLPILRCKYICYKSELGENGTKHIQGVVCFENPKTIVGARNSLGGRAHVEVMRGTIEQAVEYVAKEETTDRSEGSTPFTERGTKPKGAGRGQGTRTDLHGVYDCIKQGNTTREIVHKYPSEFIKYHKGIQAMQAAIQQVRKWITKVYWYYGPTGTGKSKTVYDKAYAGEPTEWYTKMGSNKWWDGYEGQPYIIIDDYRRDLCTFSQLLRLCDRYPMLVECKGTSTQFLAKEIYITTPLNPRETWEGRSEEDIGQLLRRITEIKHFSGLVV